MVGLRVDSELVSSSLVQNVSCCIFALLNQGDPGRVCLAGIYSAYNDMLSASVDLCKH